MKLTMYPEPAMPPSFAQLRRWGLYLTLTLGAVGCENLTGSQALPAGTPNPTTYNNPAGALGMHAAAVTSLSNVLPTLIVDEGLLTDELTDVNGLLSTGNQLNLTGIVSDPLDERILPEQFSTGKTYSSDADYNNLQKVRGYISQALGALAAYDTGTANVATARALRGELFALAGYTELNLAEFFCNGVPLSTLDFNANFTYHASSMAAQVDSDAIRKLDSAVALATASDSTRIVDLALVLKGRAWVDLGQYDSAAVAVASVPDGFQYQVSVQWADIKNLNYNNIISKVATVSNLEGGTGLPYLSNLFGVSSPPLAALLL